MQVLSIALALLALASSARAGEEAPACEAPLLRCMNSILNIGSDSLVVEASTNNLAGNPGQYQSFHFEVRTPSNSFVCYTTVVPANGKSAANLYVGQPDGDVIYPWTYLTGRCAQKIPCGETFSVTATNAAGRSSNIICPAVTCPAPPPVASPPPPYICSSPPPPPVQVSSPPPCVASPPPSPSPPPPYVCSSPPPPPVQVSSPPPCVASPPPYVCSSPPPPYVCSSPPPPPVKVYSPPCVSSPPPYCMPRTASPPPYCMPTPVTVSSPPPYVCSSPPPKYCQPPVTVSSPPPYCQSPPPKCQSPVTVYSPPPKYCQSPVTVYHKPPKYCQPPVTIYHKPPPSCGPKCGVTKWGKPVYCKPGKKCCTVTVKKWHGKHCQTYTKQECMKKCPKH